MDCISYRLTFDNWRDHCADVEANIPVKSGKCCVLFMPVWTPGSYLIREYPRNVEAIEACSGSDNTPLSISKIAKNRWQVITREGDTSIVIRYRIYCHEQSVRTNWIEFDYALLTGAATFITLETESEISYRVELVPLENWPYIATSLPPLDLTTERFEPNADEGTTIDSQLHILSQTFVRRADSFDELVDSPILMGDLTLRSFMAGGVPHYFASYGTSGFWEHDVAVEDTKRIVEYQQQYWDEIPYEHYWFLNVAVDAYGGLEHDNSTVLMARRNAMKTREGYCDWLGLVSHEFFHTWNVRRLRPKALQHYDYSTEHYIRELWIAEGVTSYIDDLLLARIGLLSEAEYIERLGKTLKSVIEAPGHLVQSLVDSSYDAWIKHYRPDENSTNARISYYTKGCVVSFLLDQDLRENSDDNVCLDDVMRELWKRHRANGYTLDDFQVIVDELSGTSHSEWFKQNIYSSEQLDLQPALDRLGLTVQPVVNAMQAECSTTNRATTRYLEFKDDQKVSDLGIELTLRDGRWIVAKVVRGGAAAESGLQCEDEILAIGGMRLPKENWRDVLLGYGESQSLEVIVSRRFADHQKTSYR